MLLVILSEFLEYQTKKNETVVYCCCSCFHSPACPVYCVYCKYVSILDQIKLILIDLGLYILLFSFIWCLLLAHGLLN